MKKRIVRNIMATTGITLVTLALIGSLYGASFLCISSVFESLGANIVIHFGFLITSRFESRYPVLEILLDISYTIMILILFGAVFHWYSSTPVWVLIIMAVLIYLLAYLINILRIRDDIRTINQLLKARKKQMEEHS